LTKTPDIQGEIPVIFFEEGGKFVAYSPALDLSSCGESLEEAKKRFGEAAAIFLREVSEMGTLDEVLAECGWHKASPGQRWVPPVYLGHLQEKVKIPSVS